MTRRSRAASANPAEERSALRRLRAASHASARSPLVPTIQTLRPWTPLRSAACASTGWVATARPNGNQGLAPRQVQCRRRERDQPRHPQQRGHIGEEGERREERERDGDPIERDSETHDREPRPSARRRPDRPSLVRGPRDVHGQRHEAHERERRAGQWRKFDREQQAGRDRHAQLTPCGTQSAPNAPSPCWCRDRAPSGRESGGWGGGWGGSAQSLTSLESSAE